MYAFERLGVYKKSRIFVNNIFKVAEKLPREMQFSLTSQVVRAAISIVANIAEGSGRISSKESRNFYNIAKGSAYEVVSLLDIALLRRYISQQNYETLYEQSEEICKMLTGLIKHQEK